MLRALSFLFVLIAMPVQAEERIEHPWALADAATPPVAAYRIADAAQLVGRWTSSIPIADKEAWRDPAVAEDYARRTIASDPTASTRTPQSARIPLGYFEDARRMSRDERVFDAGKITAHVLYARGGADFWSRPIDAANFEREAVRAASVRMVEIPNGTHYLLNDRPERGFDRFTTELVTFLQR